VRALVEAEIRFATATWAGLPMSQLRHSLPKCGVSATSAFPPIATNLRKAGGRPCTSSEPFVAILLKLSFGPFPTAPPTDIRHHEGCDVRR
jgi:hypothetical protein